MDNRVVAARLLAVAAPTRLPTARPSPTPQTPRLGVRQLTLERISKRGDGYIRRLLVHGARSVLRWRRAKPGTGPGWTDRLLARRPTNVVLVAMANKTARVAWALLRYERIYRPTPA